MGVPPDGKRFIAATANAVAMAGSIRFFDVIPTFRIFDIAKAREFYVDYLGFQIDFEHRFHEGAPLFIGISRGGIRLHLSEHHGDGSPGLHASIDMAGVDELHAELHAKKYRYMSPAIHEQEWGSREFTVYDPFNNRLTFREFPSRSDEAH